MSPKYRDEVNKLLAGLDDVNKQKKERETEIPATPKPQIQREIHYIFVREVEDEETTDYVVDSRISDQDTAPLPTKPQPQPVTNAMIGVLLLAMFVPIFCIAVQLYFIVNPYTVTLTLLARSQQISVTGTLQLGRVLNPITVSQSQTVQTTGKGHQDAKQATGTVTFYNGLFTQQFIPQGTVYTGSDGVQIVTDQDATIPPDNPPINGQATVAAHAINAGSAGNIPAGDINITINNGLLVKNDQFSGGQDERSYQVVAKSDITTTAAPLKATLDQSINGVLQEQLKPNEALVTPSCTITTTSDHQAGEEATQVKVTVSETCSAVAYNQDSLQAKVTQLLTTQAAKKVEPGYSELGYPQITVTSATAAKPVMLSFTSVSTWVYALTTKDQQQIKTVIAGKDAEKALQLLTRLPGIERVSLTTSGFGDTSRIPRDINHIHLALFYGL